MLNRASWLQKQKQDELAKERENIEASKIYAEYVKEFESSASSAPDLEFVKPVNASQQAKVESNDAASCSSGSVAQDGTTPLNEPNDPLSKEYLKFIHTPVHAATVRPTAKGKTREIDAFIKELKEKQQKQDEEKAAQQRLQSSYSPLNPSEPFIQTTVINAGSSGLGRADGCSTLHIGNLNPCIKEDDIYRHFSSLGAISNVSITPKKGSAMPPTAEALITYTNVESAKKAKDTKGGSDILGYRCTISWANFDKPSANSAFLSPLSNICVSPVIPVPPPLPLLLADEKGVNVNVPSSMEKQKIIDMMAQFVVEGGAEFEEFILSRESHDGLFNFLYDRRSPEHVYYRWKVYSLLQGTTQNQEHRKQFRIVEDGLNWNAPSEPNKAHMQAPEKPPSFQARGWKPLLDEDLEKLKEMLRNPSSTRAGIGEVMVFIIDHGESAYHVTDVLINSIKEDTDIIDRKINRMYIMSDVLFNSSASHQYAWIYRFSIEKRIPEVFHNFSDFMRTCASKIAKEQLTNAVRKMISAWEQWSVYQPEFLEGLEATMFGSGTSSLQHLSQLKENEHLLDASHDGMQMEFYDILSKLPLRWRESAFGYLLMRIKKLKQLCASRGLLTHPDTREALVTRLIAKDMYWHNKMQDDKENITQEEESAYMPGDYNINEGATEGKTIVNAAPDIDSTIIIDEDSDMDAESSAEESLPEETQSVVPDTAVESVVPAEQAEPALQLEPEPEQAPQEEDTEVQEEDNNVSSDAPANLSDDDIEDMFAAE